MSAMAVLSDKSTAVALPSEHPGAVGKPVLVVIAGPELGRRIDLDSGEVDIGRDAGLTLQIDSELVSRKHASIRRVVGKLVIADRDSTNGTYVNDRRIKTHSLEDGDQIRVGKVVLKYTECAIEAEYHEQIVLRASVDGLTGAYNKRYFEETLRKVFASARDSASGLALMVFDIDHFKRINDTWGHSAGDAALRQVAQVVRGRLRNQDALCRVGGEEFAVPLERMSLADARTVAESVRAAIEATSLSFEGSTIPMTVSLGVVDLASTDSSPEDMFRRADARLYDAKRSGRNRVC
jgi:diguanylate cyclase (GGDEF)-like protein